MYVRACVRACVCVCVKRLALAPCAVNGHSGNSLDDDDDDDDDDSDDDDDACLSSCAVDSTTEILAIQQHVTDFRFTAFEFAGNFRRVYLECDVRVCSTNENGPDCTQQCISAAPPSLGKRSSSEVLGRSAARVVTVNYGPIVIGQ